MSGEASIYRVDPDATLHQEWAGAACAGDIHPVAGGVVVTCESGDGLSDVYVYKLEDEPGPGWGGYTYPDRPIATGVVAAVADASWDHLLLAWPGQAGRVQQTDFGGHEVGTLEAPGVSLEHLFARGGLVVGTGRVRDGDAGGRQERVLVWHSGASLPELTLEAWGQEVLIEDEDTILLQLYNWLRPRILFPGDPDSVTRKWEEYPSWVRLARLAPVERGGEDEVKWTFEHLAWPVGPDRRRSLELGAALASRVSALEPHEPYAFARDSGAVLLDVDEESWRKANLVLIQPAAGEIAGLRGCAPVHWHPGDTGLVVAAPEGSLSVSRGDGICGHAMVGQKDETAISGWIVPILSAEGIERYHPQHPTANEYVAEGDRQAVYDSVSGTLHRFSRLAMSIGDPDGRPVRKLVDGRDWSPWLDCLVATGSPTCDTSQIDAHALDWGRPGWSVGEFRGMNSGSISRGSDYCAYYDRRRVVVLHHADVAYEFTSPAIIDAVFVGPDGQSATLQGGVLVLRGGDGTELGTIQATNGARVTDAEFSRDGTRLAWTSDDGYVRISNAAVDALLVAAREALAGPIVVEPSER